jgi:hypothetical protein
VKDVKIEQKQQPLFMRDYPKYARPVQDKKVTGFLANLSVNTTSNYVPKIYRAPPLDHLLAETIRN